ncbi:quinolinate synthase NadA [Desulfohalobiaceae bacterium Ax17]|jgi:quinolinate synthase|uniref:quinolinate synthase NadA n=1 Tax=Desulfovulcanus ferrireducens TaxID=2831190 RepID=UPI00207BA724|nr:quinolinate synthase NadA [Desulfovulcanus ferrireducens]MBT8763603.1 quinolinate synthase NadA [Desulfovulcanus ferrireducens]
MNQIEQIKKNLGPDLAILGHHYQNDNIIAYTDIKGDSLELARKIPELKAKYIVFCGVHFMAESAAILAQENQMVFLPALDARCVMADTAPASLVEKILISLNQEGKKIIPLAYVNSSAEVKAICGKYDGSVCTSANAPKMLAWALNQGDGVLFLPDKNLGQNMAKILGLSPGEIVTVDIRSQGKHINFGKIKDKKLFLWPGVCAIHFRFKAEQLNHIRKTDPKAKIIVHPECDPDVVAIADASGSTSFIIKYVREAEPGTRIYVGTEDNLVHRLANEYRGQKEVLPITPSLCSNMAKITEQNLLHTLKNMKPENKITVSEDIAVLARKALEKMLEVCS